MFSAEIQLHINHPLLYIYRGKGCKTKTEIRQMLKEKLIEATHMRLGMRIIHNLCDKLFSE